MHLDLPPQTRGTLSWRRCRFPCHSSCATVSAGTLNLAFTLDAAGAKRICAEYSSDWRCQRAA